MLTSVLAAAVRNPAGALPLSCLLLSRGCSSQTTSMRMWPTAEDVKPRFHKSKIMGGGGGGSGGGGGGGDGNGAGDTAARPLRYGRG